ncbi:MAG TPA: hypothetical protein VF832_09870, partial [Longimicrobiales bacterium]
HWQSLRQNMPATSVRDLVVKDNDLVLGTHGRGIWIMDDMAALRELPATVPPLSGVPQMLFTPAPAWRVRFSNYTDTPLPPDESMAPNPPDGAPIDYIALGSLPPVLEILDSAGKVVRRYEGKETDQIAPRDTGNVPWYWVRPPQTLVASPGGHRFVWDLHYQAPPFPHRDFPISAVPARTPLEPRGPWAPPGRYTVRLTVQSPQIDGMHRQTYEKPLVVRMDPRVKTSAGLEAQFQAATQLADALTRDSAALADVRAFRTRIRQVHEQLKGAKKDEFPALDSLAAALEGGGGGEGEEAPPRARAGRGTSIESLTTLAGQLQSLYELVQAADVAPTTQAQAAIKDRLAALDIALASWTTLKARGNGSRPR